MHRSDLSPIPAPAYAHPSAAIDTIGGVRGSARRILDVAANSVFGQLAQVVGLTMRQTLTVGEREELARLRRCQRSRGLGDDLEGDESAWVATRPMPTDR
jgi:hypothetical protein